MNLKLLILAFVSFFFICSHAQQIPPNPPDLEPSNALGYYENKGQIVYPNLSATDVLYYSEHGSIKAYLRENSISLCQYSPEDTAQNIPAKTYRLDIDFVCNDNHGEFIENCVESVIPSEPTGDHLNYYAAHCPQGIEDVKGYKRIVYQNAWTDIDFHAYSNPYHILNLMVAEAGADLSKIKFQFSGQDSIRIDQINPELLEGHIGDHGFTFPLTQAYQFNGNTLLPLNWTPQWVDLGNNVVGLTGIGSYNPSLPVVIRIEKTIVQKPTSHTPGIPWRTYYGNPDVQLESYLATDDKYVYNVISSFYQMTSTQFPASGGEYSSPGLGSDIITSKFDPSDKHNRRWATYLESQEDEYASAIDVMQSTNGELAIAGHAVDVSLPVTTGPSFFQGPPNNNSNLSKGFVLTLQKSDGFRVWGTWLGESTGMPLPGSSSIDPYPEARFHSIRSLHFNEDGTYPRLFVAGHATKLKVHDMTSSTIHDVNKFPVRNIGNSYFKSNNIEFYYKNGIIMEFNMNNHDLVYSTLVNNGGQYDDLLITDISTQHGFNGDISIIAVGYCENASAIPLTNHPGAYYQTTKANNSSDEGFLLRWNINTNNERNIDWGTLFGGNKDDQITSVDVSPINNEIVISGSTNSDQQASNSPIANNSNLFPLFYQGNQYHQGYMGGNSDNFIASFEENGELNWSTYIGSNGQEGWQGICTGNFFCTPNDRLLEGISKAIYDIDGNILFCGTSQETNSGVSNIPVLSLMNSYNQSTISGTISTNPSTNINPANSDIYLCLFKDKELAWGTYYGGNEVSISTSSYRQVPFSFEITPDISIVPSKTTSDKFKFYLSTHSFSASTPGSCDGSKYCQEYLDGVSDITIAQLEYNISNVVTSLNENSDISLKPYILYSENDKLEVIISESESSQIRIYNSLGQSVLKVASKKQEIEINTSNLSSGFYIISITLDNKVYNEKIFIN